MKRAMCAIVFLVIAASFCMAAGTVENAAVAPEKYIELTKVFYYGDASDFPDYKEQFMTDFSAKFGVKLKINTFPRNEYMDKVNLAITSGQLTGMVGVFTPGDALRYREDDVIYSLDSLLATNTTWRSMPDSYKNAFKFYGETWAVGSGWSPTMFARVVRQDWLDKLGMKMPQTIDDLYNMAKAFTENDPDGNGKNDTVGIVSSGTWNLQDVFQAFDARLNNFGADPICWDENANAYVDSFLKPTAVDALAFLAKLYANKYMDQELFTNGGAAMREKMWSGKYGSTYYWLNWGDQQLLPTLTKNVPTATYGITPALAGNRTKNINFTIMSAGTPYVLLKNTPNAKEMINAYFDVFMNDDLAYLWGSYGIEGTNFRVDTKGRVLTAIDPTTNAAANPGLLSGRHPTWPADKYVMFPDQSESEIAKIGAIYEFERTYMQAGISAGLLSYMTPAKDTFVSTKYTEIINDVRKIFDEVVAKAVTGELTPSDAVNQYRRQVKALGAQQALDECNAGAGTTAPSWAKY